MKVPIKQPHSHYYEHIINRLSFTNYGTQMMNYKLLLQIIGLPIEVMDN